MKICVQILVSLTNNRQIAETRFPLVFLPIIQNISAHEFFEDLHHGWARQLFIIILRH